jgi:hypothetical protein
LNIKAGFHSQRLIPTYEDIGSINEMEDFNDQNDMLDIHENPPNVGPPKNTAL